MTARPWPPRSGGSGSKGGIFLNAGWSGSVTGLYQVAPDSPWGFNIGGAFNAREGYPSPVFRSVTGTDGSGRAVQISSDFESSRNDDVFTLDLRLDKEIMFGDAFGMTLGLDVFNVFNDNDDPAAQPQRGHHVVQLHSGDDLAAHPPRRRPPELPVGSSDSVVFAAGGLESPAVLFFPRPTNPPMPPLLPLRLALAPGLCFSRPPPSRGAAGRLLRR